MILSGTETSEAGIRLGVWRAKSVLEIQYITGIRKIESKWNSKKVAQEKKASRDLGNTHLPLLYLWTLLISLSIPWALNRVS